MLWHPRILIGVHGVRRAGCICGQPLLHVFILPLALQNIACPLVLFLTTEDRALLLLTLLLSWLSSSADPFCLSRKVKLRSGAKPMAMKNVLANGVFASARHGV